MQQRICRVLTMAAALAGASWLPASASNMVINGNFESPAISSDYLCFTSSTVASWTSMAGTTHGSCYINDGTGGFPAAFSGGQFMYVNDFGDVGTSVQQMISLSAGTAYALTFATSGLGSTTAALSVTLGTFTTLIPSRASAGWLPYSFIYNPSVSGNVQLKFASATSGVVSIDAVSLDVSPVPEPTSALLLTSGLLVVAAYVRKRQAA